MPRGYSRPEGAVPSHHRSYLFIVFEFRSASLILNPHNSNHVIRPKPKTYHHETNVAIRVMSIKKEQDQKVSCKPPKILTYFNIIPVILYLTV